MGFAIYKPAGVDVEKATAEALFDPGTIACGENGSEWIYVKDAGAGVTGEGYAVVIDENFSAIMTAASLARGDIVGIARIAVPADYHYWAQRKGSCNVRTAASAAANVILNATATGGQLDDDNLVGAEDIDGLVLTTANGGSAGLAPAMLNYPAVGATN